MNQIVSWLALFSVSLFIAVPIVIFSEQKILDSSKSVMDLSRDAEIRASQEIIVNHFQKDGDSTVLKVANTGLYDVKVFAVLVDGTETGYSLRDQSSGIIARIAPGQLATLQVSEVGNLVQIIAESGKLFEIDTA